MTTLPSPDIPLASDEADRTPPSTGALPVQAGPAGIRVTVTVSGEFCLDNCQSLRHALRDAIMRSAEGLDLDLSELHFADCSALNVLLAARRDAVAAGKTVTDTTASPAVERLLTYTDTHSLFSPAHEHADPPARKPGPPREETDDDLLRTEVVQLRRALRTHPDIDLARGILMRFRSEPRRGVAGTGHSVPEHQHETAPPRRGRRHHRPRRAPARPGPAATHRSRRQNTQHRRRTGVRCQGGLGRRDLSCWGRS